ncbi:hypothetical protein [Vibrio vulnificus]|uniref:hypothetical protein n=1 Tax=Vibrio vulnificus TaxID=672 RepID=UPI001034C63F|nr:hypothetical protein [Vibrio vulnificus]EIT7146591.1 hypothetical protein [Vibrio vulnificus]MCU8478839.1 hypothetical protein [Vibrio vulnificus]
MKLLNALAQSSSSSGSRSTTLKPLSWLLGILLTGTIAFVSIPEFPVPHWMLVSLVGMNILAFLLYCAAYIYFMLNDPDALRSEKFNIEKMAIQQGMTGDSTVGILEEKEVPTSQKHMLAPQNSSLGQGGNS